MEELMNRVGEVYEPFKVHFLRKPVRPLGPDEVLVKVRASAICGSDLHIARGLHPSAPLPVTIGHEFSGDVVAIGSEVTKARVGERVHRLRQVRCLPPRPVRLLRAHQLYLPQRRWRYG